MNDTKAPCLRSDGSWYSRGAVCGCQTCEQKRERNYRERMRRLANNGALPAPSAPPKPEDYGWPT